jgi:hypothetical protein
MRARLSLAKPLKRFLHIERKETTLKRTFLGIIALAILVIGVVLGAIFTLDLFKTAPETIRILADGDISP